MTRTFAVVAVACIGAAACADAPPTTWARKMTREQAQHWGEACGPEGTAYPKMSSSQLMIRGWSTDRTDGVSIDCTIHWDEANGRPRFLTVRVGGPPGYVPSIDDIGPYLHVLENELPQSLRPYVRRFAPPGPGYIRKGDIAIEVITNMAPPDKRPTWSLIVTDSKAFTSP